MWNSKLYILALLLVLSSLGKAQDSLSVDLDLPKEIDTTEVKMPLLSSISILYDYGKLVGLFLDTEAKYEFGAEIAFKNKVLFIGEFGFSTLKPNGAYQNTDYTSEGMYYRLGVGYKFDMTESNNFSMSGRYVKSRYSDKGEVKIESASGLYDDLTQSFERSEISAYWYEFVLSSETRIWKGLYLGFHARIKFMGDYDNQEPLDVFSIPGYGRTFDKSVPTLNLYVKYSFERFK